MSTIIDAVWDMLRDAVSQAKTKDDRVSLDYNAKIRFEESFRDKYEFVKDRFMKESVEGLDRHKVASIIIASIIESDVILYQDEIHEDKTFFGKYLIAVSVGMSYMQNRLNKILLEKDEKTIDRYCFPLAFSCTTPYFAIFARNLYFTHEETDWKLNLLDMSEILFLLEYITLNKNDIDVNKLIEDEKEE